VAIERRRAALIKVSDPLILVAMTRVRQYRSFQVNVAPGVYGGFTLLGAFIYFLAGHQWLFTVAAWFFIMGISYIDRPFKFILLNNKLKFLAFICVVSISIILPAVVFLFGANLGEFIGMMLIPVGGLLTGVFVYFIYNEDILRRKGWIDISGR
jgi:hypothetical protein